MSKVQSQMKPQMHTDERR